MQVVALHNTEPDTVVVISDLSALTSTDWVFHSCDLRYSLKDMMIDRLELMDGLYTERCATQ